MFKKIMFLMFAAASVIQGSLHAEILTAQDQQISKVQPIEKDNMAAGLSDDKNATELDLSFDIPMEEGVFGLDQLKTLEAEIGVSSELTFGQKMALTRAFVSARIHAAKQHIYENKEIYLIAVALAVAAGITWYSMKHKNTKHACRSGCKHKH